MPEEVMMTIITIICKDLTSRKLDKKIIIHINDEILEDASLMYTVLHKIFNKYIPDVLKQGYVIYKVEWEHGPVADYSDDDGECLRY